VSYQAGTYKEINDNLAIALERNPNMKTIVRAIDPLECFEINGNLRYDTGTYPTYLYDKNPFNDVKYLFNKDVLLNRIIPMISETKQDGFLPGITSFDEYDNWQQERTFGKNTILPDGIDEIVSDTENVPIEHLSNEERDIIEKNIRENVTSLVEKYPDVDFYYFFSPYSIASWWETIKDSSMYKQIEAEQCVIELLLEYDNIHLFSFNNRTDIITDLNYYADYTHYGEWINSLILKWMHEGMYQLTKDNYEEYLSEELMFYSSFDYSLLELQEDYDQDIYAAALLNEELTGIVPMEIISGETLNTNIVIENANMYDYLVFYLENTNEEYDLEIYDENEHIIYEHINFQKSENQDDKWQRIVIDLTDITTTKLVIQNNGYITMNGTINECAIKDITLY